MYFKCISWTSKSPFSNIHAVINSTNHRKVAVEITIRYKTQETENEASFLVKFSVMTSMQKMEFSKSATVATEDKCRIIFPI